MGLFSKDKSPDDRTKHLHFGQRKTDRMTEVDGGLHSRLAGQGRQYIDQVRSKDPDDHGWSPKLSK